MRSIKFDQIGQKEVVRGVRPINPVQASLPTPGPGVLGSAPKPPAPPTPTK